MNLQKRFLTITVITLIMMSLLLIRLSYVKVFKSAEYYERALDLWTRSAPIEGRRGNIYDRNGELIVGSKLTPTVIVIPKQIKDINSTSKKISKIVNCTPEAILKHLRKSVSVEILKPEAQKITVEQALEIIKLDIEGVYVVGDSSRYYPYPGVLSQVIGIVGIDNQGISGIEYIYDEYLKGSGGALQIYTDAHGDLMEDFSTYYNEAKTGYDLYLTVDINVQLSLERVMNNAITKYTPNDMVGLIMNPKTSEVLAMASRPTFDLENYQNYSQEIYNRNLPIWKSFEPGSTFKIIVIKSKKESRSFLLKLSEYNLFYFIFSNKDFFKSRSNKNSFFFI